MVDMSQPIQYHRLMVLRNSESSKSKPCDVTHERMGCGVSMLWSLCPPASVYIHLSCLPMVPCLVIVPLEPWARIQLIRPFSALLESQTILSRLKAASLANISRYFGHLRCEIT